ncbi:MAG: hypothetical protein B7Z73_09510 [Planctomycetia bacterium 21-64-5]|nr:MAG: hypothetical protein B7Z73_09510 [Planctomycetia bacterium 21-64-5]
MRFDVLTLFPEMFPGYLSQSLLNLAIERGLVDVRLHNIRDWAEGRHKSVDDRPYGGGPGMVLMVKPVVECVEAVAAQTDEPGHLVMLSPQGRRLDQSVVEELAGQRRLILLCGRYEGFDERVKEILQPDEISIGDFVLNTRPREFRGHEVPEVLIGGNHGEIARWRREQSLKRTQERRMRDER